jgi:hypothetical protein
VVKSQRDGASSRRPRTNAQGMRHLFGRCRPYPVPMQLLVPVDVRQPLACLPRCAGPGTLGSVRPMCPDYHHAPRPPTMFACVGGGEDASYIHGPTARGPLRRLDRTTGPATLIPRRPGKAYRPVRWGRTHAPVIASSGRGGFAHRVDRCLRQCEWGCTPRDAPVLTSTTLHTDLNTC